MVKKRTKSERLRDKIPDGETRFERLRDKLSKKGYVFEKVTSMWIIMCVFSAEYIFMSPGTLHR